MKENLLETISFRAENAAADTHLLHIGLGGEGRTLRRVHGNTWPTGALDTLNASNVLRGR